MKPKSPIGRSFEEIAQARIARDDDFVRALLQEAAQALLSDEIDVARALLRDVIKGSMGYAELSKRTGTPEKSLIRMFGPNGNPTGANLSAVLAHLQSHSGITLQVEAVRVPVLRRKTRPRAPARSVA